MHILDIFRSKEAINEILAKNQLDFVEKAIKIIYDYSDTGDKRFNLFMELKKQWLNDKIIKDKNDFFQKIDRLETILSVEMISSYDEEKDDKIIIKYIEKIKRIEKIQSKANNNLTLELNNYLSKERNISLELYWAFNHIYHLLKAQMQAIKLLKKNKTTPQEFFDSYEEYLNKEIYYFKAIGFRIENDHKLKNPRLKSFLEDAQNIEKIENYENLIDKLEKKIIRKYKKFEKVEKGEIIDTSQIAEDVIDDLLEEYGHPFNNDKEMEEAVERILEKIDAKDTTNLVNMIKKQNTKLTENQIKKIVRLLQKSGDEILHDHNFYT